MDHKKFDIKILESLSKSENIYSNDNTLSATTNSNTQFLLLNLEILV